MVMAEGERPLRNFRNLLDWSVERQDHPPGDESLQSADEDKVWLNEALRHYTGADDVTVMQDCLKILQESEESGTESDKQLERKEDALEMIADKVESIDNAQDFITIGGLPIIFNSLQTKETMLQWRAAEVLSVVVQNNPHCQSQVFAAGGLEILMHAVENSLDDQVKTKALYALSSLTRGFPDALKAFISGRGISAVIRAMQSDSEKLRVKAVFMLKNIIEEQPDVTDTLCDQGIVWELSSMLEVADSSSSSHFCEHVAAALLSLAQVNPHCLLECKNPQLKLEETLHKRLDSRIGEQEEHREEIEYCRQLLGLCFPQETGTESGDNTADR